MLAHGLVPGAELIARDKLSLPVSPAGPVPKRGGSCGNSRFRSISFRAVPMSAKHPAAHYDRASWLTAATVRFNYLLRGSSPLRARSACRDTRPVLFTRPEIQPPSGAAVAAPIFAPRFSGDDGFLEDKRNR